MSVGDPISSKSSGSTLSAGRMGRMNGKEVATAARLVSMDVNEDSWSSLASSRGSSKKSGFGGLASCGTLSVRESLARSAKRFRFTGFGLATGTRGMRRPSKASVGSRAEEDVVGQGFGQWDSSSVEGVWTLARKKMSLVRDSGNGTRRRRLVFAVSRSFKPQSLKLWSACKVKVETVKDQSSHSIKVNHRGPGSRLKVKAIKNKLIQECQSELQEPRSRFKRGTRARSELKQWQ
ncbi:hypothetical protein B0F90DRAFT_1926749 [Multifurca ochricompacta]|uniref:Uncharacterized protein n=1 Tax=Multifurca ochricompacta TaxID=376703 RepID=A0AAD4QM26_9AGAM|nr:hypothetical protein B0F90DRAFT_1926749 [Multifurca ochricompacta]